MANKAKTMAEKLQDHALATLMGKSDLVAVDVHIVGRYVDDGGNIAEVDLGSFSAPPRQFSSTSRGFYLNGKVSDPTLAGQVEGTRYQVGCNIIAIGSKTW